MFSKFRVNFQKMIFSKENFSKFGVNSQKTFQRL